MCLYNRLMENPKYKANKKNGGNIPPIHDQRLRYVPIGCGECIECRHKKARDWQVRLSEDIKHNTNGKFVTLTFNNDSLLKITEKVRLDHYKKYKNKLQGYLLDNKIATYAIDKFSERWRKKYKKFPRHWLITELGHEGTEHVHMHGIIWADNTEEIVNKWQYGFVWCGKDIQLANGKIRVEQYVNDKTINYCMKYVTKIDEKHKTYKPIILCSNGIGKNYSKTENFKKHKFKKSETIEFYRTSTGHKISLPIYYRNKAFTEEEREQLWIEKLNQETRFVRGEKISVANGEQDYEILRDFHREKNRELGYGSGQHSDEAKEYERQRRIIAQETRIAKIKAIQSAYAAGGSAGSRSTDR